MIGASHVFLSGHECGHRVRIDQREGEAEAYPAKYPDIVSRYLAPHATHRAAQDAHPEQSHQVSRQNGRIPRRETSPGLYPALWRDSTDPLVRRPESRQKSRRRVAIGVT